MPNQTASETERFYDRLVEGEVRRGVFGKDARYAPIALRQKASLDRYFTKKVRPLIGPKDRVLDFGCGPGTFASLVADFCGEIIGVDLSQGFVDIAQHTFSSLNQRNAKAIKIKEGTIPLDEGSFDVLLLIDVIHHLDDIESNLRTAFKMLKPSGRVIVYEPNKLNPMMYLLHLLDPNERGLLRVGRPGIYRKILGEYVNIERLEFNGIVVGPSSRVYGFISDFINRKEFQRAIGWLNPKIFITGTLKS